MDAILYRPVAPDGKYGPELASMTAASIYALEHGGPTGWRVDQIKVHGHPSAEVLAEYDRLDRWGAAND